MEFKGVQFLEFKELRELVGLGLLVDLGNDGYWVTPDGWMYYARVQAEGGHPFTCACDMCDKVRYRVRRHIDAGDITLNRAQFRQFWDYLFDPNGESECYCCAAQWPPHMEEKGRDKSLGGNDV